MTDHLGAFIDAYADTFAYAFDNNIMLQWYPRRIMSLTHANDSVLELGVGHGYTCNLFSQFYDKYLVIDGSESVIRKFTGQFPDSAAQIIHAYFEEFEAEEAFDVIVMGFVLEHVDDPAQVLIRYKQFLAPGGRCFVAVPNAESLHRRFGHAAGLLADMETLGPGDLALGHQRLFTVASLSTLLQDCGYRILLKEGVFLKPFTTAQLESLSLQPHVLEAMCKVGQDYPELSAGLMFQAELAQ